MNRLEYHANGKLLLTGEYVVLEGALSLALPCRYGQRLVLEYQDDVNALQWKSFDYKNNCWFDAIFNDQLNIIHTSDTTIAVTLQQLLANAAALNQDFSLGGKKIDVYLEFPRNWGLGSSSTLVALVAQVFDVSPFTLQFSVFGGSGYDVACAMISKPILYQLVDEKPEITQVGFAPIFRNKLLFVHQNKKQNSRVAIQNFRKNATQASIATEVAYLSNITEQIAICDHYETFQSLLKAHEQRISALVKLPMIQTQFADYNGVLKSLGAWGGDFFLAAGNDSLEESTAYFKQKGFSTVVQYDDLVEGLPISF